ncbi:hypothetical protein ANANG_G00241220 [Anguilla anguilla]|uniref:TRAF-type domain-containing protein n=1 Tax=Anguilla anguilla TaxID=7936 RepID=A0A9D3RP15_ANGAN|nr:hypothetical protein ANANG_G00241220 [Anguilla anguilla]
MGRQKKAVAGQHAHCETCFSRRCTVPVEISVSCPVASCRLLCGAVFHACKQEEHQLLCPLEKVPCLNAANGCPFALTRRRLARHLERCPASVVTCSLDWNRWPVAESDGALYGNLLQGSRAEEPLDLSMAVRDQALLFRSLKMEALFPELMEREEKPVLPEEVQGAVGGGAIVGGLLRARGARWSTGSPIRRSSRRRSATLSPKTGRWPASRTTHRGKPFSARNGEAANRRLRTWETIRKPVREKSRPLRRANRQRTGNAPRDATKGTAPAPPTSPRRASPRGKTESWRGWGRRSTQRNTTCTWCIMGAC